MPGEQVVRTPGAGLERGADEHQRMHPLRCAERRPQRELGAGRVPGEDDRRPGQLLQDRNDGVGQRVEVGGQVGGAPVPESGQVQQRGPGPAAAGVQQFEQVADRSEAG